MSENKLEVLIVEDNPGDAYMIKEMLQDLKLKLNISVARDGQLALDILNDGNNALPGLVILDLNLPRVNGFDVLRFMKDSPKLKPIPVVIMTGSLRSEDEQRSRKLGAVDYCIKPATAEEIERSEMCLRAHLESLSRVKGAKGGSLHSFSNQLYLYDLNLNKECKGVLMPHRERFVMDAFNHQPWDLWK